MVLKGHFAQGLKLYSKCLEICPDDVYVLAKLSLCYAHTGNRGKAIELIDDALKLDPKNEMLIYNREQFVSGVELKGIVVVDENGKFIERIENKP